MIDVFIAYAHNDLGLKNELKKFLRPLTREGRVSVWDDFDIEAGTDWDSAIKQRLYTAQVVLLLVSSDALASEYFYSEEVKRALERHKRGEVRVIPVILRVCDWKNTALGKLEALPEKSLPVVKWPSHDEAFQNVVDRLREVVDDLEHRRHFQGALGVARYLARREAWVEAARAYAIALALHRDDFDPTKLVLEREQAECESEAPAPLVAPVLASAPPPDTTQAADDAYWEALADGDAAACAKYLERYPKGRHAAAARQRHEALTRAAQADDFVLVKGGTFQMGDVMGDKESTNETAHTVTLNDFYLARHALTFTEYDAFCEATGREKPGDEGWGRGKRPVINVSWYDAVEYCNWRSEQEGRQPAYEVDKSRKDANNKDENDALKWVVFFNSSANGYRLPTEAEWEYAAREGGKKVRFGNGRDVADPSEINFNASSEGKKAYSIAGEYRQRTVPVDEFPANALGLKQMSGNVLEWCWDWYGAKFYTESNGAGNPRGASAGASRVLRGGSFVDASQYCRTANRYAYQPTARRRSDGFRLASSL